MNTSESFLQCKKNITLNLDSVRCAAKGREQPGREPVPMWDAGAEVSQLSSCVSPGHKAFQAYCEENGRAFK